MLGKKDNTMSTSSEELDLENILNETVDQEEDTENKTTEDDTENKTTEHETENNIVDTNVEQNVKQYVQSDDKSDGVLETENKEIHNEQKEDTHGVVLQPCYMSLNKLNIANYKQQTVNEHKETEDKDTGDIVQQPKETNKKNLLNAKTFQTLEKKFRILCPMLMTDMSVLKENVPVIMAQSELFFVTC